MNGQIDLLLGACELAQCVKSGSLNEPIAQDTEFGWIISGKNSAFLRSPNVTVLVTDVEIDEKLSQSFRTARFFPRKKFKRNTIKRKNGHYIVNIPFKNNMQWPYGQW